VISVSQYVPSVWPLGRSNATVQALVALAVPLVIVYLPWYPVPQSESLLNVAVTLPAACAGRATAIAAPSRRAAPTAPNRYFLMNRTVNKLINKSRHRWFS
jgi:hypothetical protein